MSPSQPRTSTRPDMHLLALETSGLTGSVAVADGPQVLREINLPPGQRSARALAPAIRQILLDVGWKPTDLEVIAVTSGPGSFTGLRVGCVTAKVLAYATACRIVGVNTLEALARQAASPEHKITTILDAQRGEFFAASWSVDARGEIEPREPTRIVTVDELREMARNSGKIAGPVVEKLAGQLPSSVAAIKIPPQASAVAAQGWRVAERGEFTDPFALIPQYLRRTAAEEQWEKRQEETSGI